MLRKRTLFLGGICHFLSLSIVFTTLPFTVKDSDADDAVPAYLGSAMATGKAFLLQGKNRRLTINNSPLPLFDKSTIRTEDGIAVVSLVPNGLVEVHGGSEVHIAKNAGRDTLQLKAGVIRFVIPSGSAITVVTPTAEVKVNAHQRLASTGASVPGTGGDRVGVVGIDDKGAAYVGSTKGTFDVAVAGGNTLVLKPGDRIMLAKVDTGGGKGFMDELTRTQLSELSAKEGVRVIPTVKGVPSLTAGEVAVPIPANIGGGYILGTPEAIAAAVEEVGITRTTIIVEVRAAAIAEGVLDLSGLTRAQLSKISEGAGIKVLTGRNNVPPLKDGEVALCIPDGIGGGLIIGTPDNDSEALTTAGIPATASAIAKAAVERSCDTKGGAGRWVGAGLLIVAVAALAGGGGGGGGGGGAASPSSP